MDNNQFQKNVYQVPSSPSGESFSAPEIVENIEISQEEINKKFVDIQREYVRDTFNQMTQDLEMSLSGYEVRQQPKVELMSPNPIATELLQIGTELMDLRNQHVIAYDEAEAARQWYHRMFTTLFGKRN